MRLKSHLHSPVSKLSEIALTRGRAGVHRRVAEQTFKRLGLEKTIQPGIQLVNGCPGKARARP